MPIRNNLKVIMADRGVRSYSELARRIDFNNDTVRNFAIGIHRRVDSKLLEAICKELNCELKDLLYIEKREA
ncbi:helix-turn-helix transcriptional regulator [Bacillus infantis]|uniref:helix-turn-helix domain-containing protein n=1 Tax=Bacillus infantis TaxID=324767 RepID=UPI002002ED96|nr:helix-turn-helix transcriptional regulator [Bacillus infantis]MCK6203961.1 helix-turn-helix transcriptional regulator [Bacillus infantis]